MKTVIVKSNGDRAALNKFVQKLEKYTSHIIDGAVICTRYLATENYHTVHGELKDATLLNDFDLFIIAVVPENMDLQSLPNINRARTLVCDASEYSSAKNYIIMQ